MITFAVEPPQFSVGALAHVRHAKRGRQGVPIITTRQLSTDMTYLALIALVSAGRSGCCSGVLVVTC